MDLIALLIGAPAATGSATLYLMGSQRREKIWNDIKGVPGAADKLIEKSWESTRAAAERKLADMRMDVITTKDPQTGELGYQNISREVVDFRQEIDRAEKLRKQAEKNTNRFNPPERF